MTKQICPNCGTEFDPADRASPNATDGSVNQMIYCSWKCKQAVANRRYYQRHRDKLLLKSLERQGFDEAAQKLREKMEENS